MVGQVGEAASSHLSEVKRREANATPMAYLLLTDDRRKANGREGGARDGSEGN